MWPLLVLWDVGASSVILQVSGVIIAFTVSVSLVRFLARDDHVPIRDASKRHNWQTTSMLNRVSVNLFYPSIIVVGVITLTQVSTSLKCHLCMFISFQVCYCSVCEVLLAQGEGVFCDCCGVCAHVGCVTSADSSLKCKVVHSTDSSPFKHHWVSGKFLVSKCLSR